MPADSETTPSNPAPPDLPHTWRPFGVRIAIIMGGVAVLAICVVAWFAFGPTTRAKFTVFQRSTVIAMGLLGFACGHALARCRVVAERNRLVVVNGYRRHVYEWPQVISVSLPRGAPWAILDLADGTSQSLMGIQGSDGDRAYLAVRELRALLKVV